MATKGGKSSKGKSAQKTGRKKGEVRRQQDKAVGEGQGGGGTKQI